MKIIEATLVYLFKDEQCLMLYRNKKENDLHQSKWNGIGGKIEAGESPSECAIREVREESGLEVNSLNFAGHITFPAFDKEENDWSVFIFSSDDFSGKLTDTPDEGELHWINKEDILQLTLWEGDRYFLPLLLSKKLFLGKFVYEGKLLIQHTLTRI